MEGKLSYSSILPPANLLTVCCPVATPTAYMYRLCLEYARLWADDREAMSFSL